MKSVLIILPYFGKFDNYFTLFLNSCKFNPSINWLIYTDDKQEFSYPVNVKVHYTTFQEFKQRLQSNFEFQISLNAPYKLCDFRPAYGEALQQDIKDYDFWGHCDCDLIFGDLSHFITSEMLTRYDKIFTRGHLTIYRNTPEVNSFYRRQDKIDHKKILTDPRSFSFDEWPGVSKIWKKQEQPFYDKLVMDDIWTKSINFKPTKVLTGGDGPYHNHNKDFSEHYKSMKNIIYEFNNGKVYRKWRNKQKIEQEEVAYVHLQKRRMRVAPSVNPNHFLIVPNEFIPVVQLDLENIRRLSKKKMNKNDYRQAAKNLAKMLIRKVKTLTRA